MINPMFIALNEERQRRVGENFIILIWLHLPIDIISSRAEEEETYQMVEIIHIIIIIMLPANWDDSHQSI